MGRRLTDHDRNLGPLTVGKTGAWRPLGLVLSSGDEEDGKADTELKAYAFGWVARIRLPSLIPPHRIKHMATTWDAATIARIGRDYYFETFPREYGFRYSDGFLQVFLGPQTHDSLTTKDWCKHLPWTQWRHVRYSLYEPDGTHFWTQMEGERCRLSEPINAIQNRLDATERCPKIAFEVDDYDGERIAATCHIEEREWRFGEGWFKWLSIFRKAKVSRSISIMFAKEVGRDKGSWKGGLIGTGADIAPSESCEEAFRRWCGQDQRAKHGSFKVRFVE